MCHISNIPKTLQGSKKCGFDSKAMSLTMNPIPEENCLQPTKKM